MIMEVSLNDLNDSTDLNFIYNRFDMFSPSMKTILVTTEFHGKKYVIMGGYQNKELQLGLWLKEVPEPALREVIDFLFIKHPEVKCIRYQYAYNALGEAYAHNHFKIEIPNNSEELHARLSSKGRYNIKRERRLAEKAFEECGGIKFCHCHSSDGIAEKVLDAYFVMKEATHHAEYKMSSKEYIEKFHVTDCYWISAGERVIAVILSCEQCEAVYMENITYDNTLAKLSLGKLLYDWYLQQLIEKRKKYLYLGGGDLEYKKRYGSIEETVYTGTIRRCWRFQELLWKIKGRIKRICDRKQQR